MKKENYTILDNSIWDDDNLTHSEFRVLSYLIRLYNSNLGYSFPTRDTLVKKCKMNKDTLGKVLNSLEDKGYITRANNPNKGGRNNIYFIYKYLVVRNNNESLSEPPQDDLNNNTTNNSSGETESLTEPTTKSELLEKKKLLSDVGIQKLNSEQLKKLNKLDTDKLIKAIGIAKQNSNNINFNYLMTIYDNPIEPKENKEAQSKVVTKYHNSFNEHYKKYSPDELEKKLLKSQNRLSYASSL